MIIAGAVHQHADRQMYTRALCILSGMVIIVSSIIDEHTERIPVTRTLGKDFGVIEVIAIRIVQDTDPAAGMGPESHTEPLSE